MEIHLLVWFALYNKSGPKHCWSNILVQKRQKKFIFWLRYDFHFSKKTYQYNVYPSAISAFENSERFNVCLKIEKKMEIKKCCSTVRCGQGLGYNSDLLLYFIEISFWAGWNMLTVFLAILPYRSNFDRKEREKVTHACGTLTLGCGTVTPDCGTVTPDCGTVTLGCSTVTPDCGTVTLGCGTVTLWYAKWLKIDR